MKNDHGKHEEKMNNEGLDEKAQTPVGQENIERLLKHAYRPPAAPADLLATVEAMMHAALTDTRERDARDTTACGQDARVTRRRDACDTHGRDARDTSRDAHATGGRDARDNARDARTPRLLRWPGVAAYAAAAAAMVVFAVALFMADRPVVTTQVVLRGDGSAGDGRQDGDGRHGYASDTGMPPKAPLSGIDDVLVAQARPAAAKVELAAVGSEIRTGARERRLVSLPDGSRLFVNQATAVKVDTARQITVTAGEVFVEVAAMEGRAGGQEPSPGPSDRPLPKGEVNTPGGAAGAALPLAKFVVKTPSRDVTALGTKFVVRASSDKTDVLVTQGKVAVSGHGTAVQAGRQLSCGMSSAAEAPIICAARELDWTETLVEQANSPLVPASQHAGGSLIAIDPNGQEVKLSLRKYHVDVHIEDGFARTTIDQTYFNHEPARLEGTFYFPLPPDGSLSRLAMYVDGKLMEGGMAERDHARSVYESIVYQRRDPALLEWLDGSTFKMRVFPLEGRQEKRIILSYTQRLDNANGQTAYRFPAGHNLQAVRDWSFAARVKNAAGIGWNCDSHGLVAAADGGDLLLTATEKNALVNKDISLKLNDGGAMASLPVRFATAYHDGKKYLVMRYRPELIHAGKMPALRAGETPATPTGKMPVLQRRDWVFLFERTGDRDPLLARTQIDVVRSILENAQHDDRFAILLAGTRTLAMGDGPVEATPENVAAAIAQLEKTHLVGAMDLEAAIASARPILAGCENPHLVHVGSGVAVLGQRKEDALAAAIPAGTKYVGIGVGRKWARSFMRHAAGRTGGLYTQINPDENVAWRAFQTLSTLNMPRLMNIEVASSDPAVPAGFLTFEESAVWGQEICAIARLDGQALPTSVTVRGMLDGEPFTREVLTADAGGKADYASRMWAKLQIDQWVANDADGNKAKIIELSKAMYVMSPFTSLLVLENEKMYEEFKIDRGRKDHWAMYPAPEKIDVVSEPIGQQPAKAPATEPAAKAARPSVDEVLATIYLRIPVPMFYDPNYGHRGGECMNVRDAMAYGYGTWDYYIAEFEPIKGDKRVDGKDSSRAARFLNGLQNGGEWSRPISWRQAKGFDKPVDWRELNSLPTSGIMLPGGKLRPSMGPMGRGPMPDAPMSYWRPTPMILGASDGKGKSIGKQYTHLLISGSGLLRIDGRLSGLNYLAPRSSSRLTAGDRIQKSELGVGFDLVGMAEVADIPFDGGWLDYRAYGLNYPHQWANQWAYHAPVFTNDARVFADLLAYAPGFRTTMADIQAVLAEEADVPAVRRGKVDPAAARLIAAARKTGWRQATFGDKDDAVTVLFDGSGRFVIQTARPGELAERIICDGENLYHVYDEIGLASRRPMNGVYRGQFAQVLPFVVSCVEDLSAGADVRLIDENTIAVVPLSNDEDTLRQTTLEGGTTAQGGTSQYQYRLVFGRDGRLIARMGVLVEAGKAEVLWKQTLGADGTITFAVGDSNDAKAAHSVKARLASAKAPSMEIDKALVVLPMPMRSPQHVAAKFGKEMPGNHAGRQAQIEKWSASEAMELLSAYLGTNDRNMLALVTWDRFFDRDDFRLGLYTILSSVGDWTASVAEGKHRPDVHHPASPLANYLMAVHVSSSVEIKAAKGSFLYELGQFRKLAGDLKAGNHKTEDVDKALDFARMASPRFASATLMLLNGHSGSALSVADGWKRFEGAGGLAYFGRYENARMLGQRGYTDRAAKAFEKLLGEQIASGVVPVFDNAAYSAILGHATSTAPADQGPARWANMMHEAAGNLMKLGDRPAVIALAWQCRQVGDQVMGEELVDMAVAGVGEGDRVAVSLEAMRYYSNAGQPNRAEAIIASLLADKKNTANPWLWRIGAVTAASNGNAALSLRCLEKAMDLEYAEMGELVNLQAVREDYTQLLSAYGQIAKAVSYLEGEPSRELAGRIIRAADRWRSMDSDDTQACNLAAYALRSLGAKDAAWDYMTTPLADKPNEASSWAGVARELRGQGELELAARAFATAFAAESTDAQLLWEQAQVLQQAGKTAQARDVYRKLAAGTWHFRFDWVKGQAIQQVGKQP